LWIGSGWCSKPEWTGRGSAAGQGGSGIHAQRRWQGGGQGGGSGVHAPRLSQQKPQLTCNEDGSTRGAALMSMAQSGGLYEYLGELAARLRRVRVCCGDWKRVLTPSVTTYVGVCGVLLDPPYSHDLRERCYSEDHDISAEVREWAVANGDNPDFRIALGGYEGEHAMPDTWECVAWKAHGGYSRTERGKANRERERVWFSPHCLAGELPLFAEMALPAEAL
jgi:DNA adenine methylase